MHYFYRQKLLEVKIKLRDDNVSGDIYLKVEFTQAEQMDGHVPSHGDLDLGFAEVLIQNIDPEPIIKELLLHGYSNFKRWTWHTACLKVKALNKLDPDVFMPLYEMELSIGFTPEEDMYRSAVKHLLNMVSPNAVKQAIKNPGEYFSR
jgi:hypothetical protein